MKKWVMIIILVAVLIIGVIIYALVKGGGSFGFSFSSATIKDAKSCRAVDEDKNPTGITSTFVPNSPEIFIWFSWAHTMKGTEAKAVWIYEPSNLIITEVSVVLEDMAGWGSFALTCPTTEDGWPLGDYRVDIYLGDKLAESVNFKVILPAGVASDCEKFNGVASDECYFIFALGDKDDSLCELIIESIPKNICHAVVTNNADLCEEITDSDGKDDCYGTYAISNKDSSSCEKIIDSTKKSRCYDNTS
ncbi:hypothetical protein KAR52_01020 [Candidatus Pacearchaeota archaeon]|nr:hypothetical protein [Candidatus Pacearchaeota archaeon]